MSFRTVGASGGVTFVTQIPFDKISKALGEFSEEIRAIGLARAINVGGRAGGAKMFRALAKQTGLTQGVVRKCVKVRRANRGNLTYQFIANSKALPLSAFGLSGKAGRPKRGGSYQVWARAWGVKKVYKRAFVLTSKRTGVKEAYKRVKGSKGRHNIKMLYGPIISREMIRVGESAVGEIMAAAVDIAVNRLPHELMYAVAQAKARSGT